MVFPYKDLPFEYSALEPFISAETMHYHHDKHYKKYIDTLNQLLSNSTAPKKYDSLEAAMIGSHLVDKAIFENAAQAWNHEFYWNSLSASQLLPASDILVIIENQFDSIEKFQSQFKQAAMSLFGSGWVWLVKTKSGEIEIQVLEKAENPLTSGDTPLLVCDMWEHAFYLDFKNDKTRYLDQFSLHINWNFLATNIGAPRGPEIKQTGQKDSE